MSGGGLGRPADGGRGSRAEPAVIVVPARAREELGHLSYYLEQMVHHLRAVSDHLQGSTRKVPGVLRELRSVAELTESAAVRVLDECEALVADGQQLSALLAEAARAGEPGGGGVLTHARALATAVSQRALNIMTALEFQDLTAQKLQRAFAVLEEVGSRLGKIRALVDAGPDAGTGAEPPEAPPAAEGKTGQALADELLERFQR
jgi:chemotaxis regulatin CheY-phosphate phosphatase CheZ